MTPTSRRVPPAQPPAADLATRERLLATAARLFAARGVATVSVRDICREAGANVAAVNYHFGGKHGLYVAVMNAAINTMQATTAAAREAGAGLDGRGRLGAFVRTFLHRTVGLGRESWIHRLMLRELSDPTPVLERVASDVLRPRLDYLCEAMGEAAGVAADHPAVVRSAISLTSQFHGLMSGEMMRAVVPGFEPSADRLDEIADHITRFSLGGLSAVLSDAATETMATTIGRAKRR
jgi:AcrR family transcriptional regulator